MNLDTYHDHQQYEHDDAPVSETEYVYAVVINGSIEYSSEDENDAYEAYNVSTVEIEDDVRIEFGRIDVNYFYGETEDYKIKYMEIIESNVL